MIKGNSRLQYYEKHLKDCCNELGCNHPSTINAINAIGLFYHHMIQDQQKAIKYHKEALHTLLHQDEPCRNLCSIAETLSDIGNAHVDMNDLETGKAFYHEALRVYKQAGVCADYHRVMSIQNRMTHASRGIYLCNEISKESSTSSLHSMLKVLYI